MNYTEAFAAYGAKLTNPQWSVSAFGKDGDLVVCLWQNNVRLGPRKGTMEYEDKLSAWLGNVPGRNELAVNLRRVKADGMKLRLVLAHPKSSADAERVGKVADESSIAKTFSVRTDVIGILEEFNDDDIRIVFAKAP